MARHCCKALQGTNWLGNALFGISHRQRLAVVSVVAEEVPVYYRGEGGIRVQRFGLD